ncbi:hypothetical protein [Aminobacter aminovorans]|uniref:hypothetical protein n=1 Tax=Aminobacter aminovorans TaxID=83263 RepID=UPI001FDF825F|nr:hypothetical protein [Aminobacter aminovorans]
MENFDIRDAIQREKSLKRWPRQWTVELIERTHPEWHECFAGSGVIARLLSTASTFRHPRAEQELSALLRPRRSMPWGWSGYDGPRFTCTGMKRQPGGHFIPVRKRAREVQPKASCPSFGERPGCDTDEQAGRAVRCAGG